MSSADKPFTLPNAWNQLNLVPSPALTAEADELPDGIHPDRVVNLTQLRSAWRAPKGSEEARTAARSAYEAGDRLEARAAWGRLLLSVYPALGDAPQPDVPASAGFRLRR